MNKKLLIIFDESSILNLKSLKNNFDKFKILFLNPNLEAKFKVVVNEEYDTYKVNYSELDKNKVINNSIEFINKFKNKFQNSNIKFHELISIYHYSYVILNSLQYFDYVVPDVDEYVIFDNGSWLTINYKKIILNKIIDYNINNKIGTLFIDKVKLLYFRFIITIYNNLIIFINRKKEKIIVTAANYGFPNLFKKLDRHFSFKGNFIISSPHKFTFIICLKKILQILLLKKNNYVTLFHLPNYLQKNKIKEVKYIKEILNNDTRKFSYIIENTILNIIHNYSIFEESNLNLLKVIKPKKIIAHHIRWDEALLTAYNAKKLNIPIYLISHGSHCYNDNQNVNKETLIHLNDMLTSELANKYFIQSPLALETLKFFNLYDSKKIIKIKPIMWGFQKFVNKNKNLDKFVILHASTTKVFAPRPFMYETPFEYIRGLNKLISSIQNIKNCKLIIRHRNTKELNVETLKVILKIKQNNIVIKEYGEFIDDLNQSDLLISYSSTTIEEAINLRKPVLLFGGGNYNHINSTMTEIVNSKNNGTIRKPIYLANDNIEKTIIDMKNLFFNKPLINEEIDNFAYSDVTFNENKFINYLIK